MCFLIVVSQLWFACVCISPIAYGINIDWVGKIVETVSGQRLGDYLQQHLLAPLGMHSTSFQIFPSQRVRLASVHARGPDEALAVFPTESRRQPPCRFDNRWRSMPNRSTPAMVSPETAWMRRQHENLTGSCGKLMHQYCPSGVVELQVRGSVIWGKPCLPAH